MERSVGTGGGEIDIFKLYKNDRQHASDGLFCL
jgi:hypothetical protein